ncbi:carboxymuconolactone decarboxylase family protein [Actinokineospora soli]|uniref:Carboxymuconolactone decarboxylase family protein n=1 Tax=Actinokineospora soli TaxID=1048753 RepID=A0ABW2TPI6_9PSEU
MRVNVAEVAPDAYKAMLGLEKYLAGSSLPKTTFELVKLRASQINGCAYCVDMHAHDAKAAGETDERLFAVAAWREAPYFTDAERAALAFAESATRLADHGHGVPDEVWDEAAAHYDEQTLAALIVAVSTINAWNRIAVATRAVAGSHRK